MKSILWTVAVCLVVAGVWLIYADFFEAAAPEGWPEGDEFDGGALAYFSIHWAVDDDGKITLKQVLHEVPPALTGVDWAKWSESTKKADLSD